MILEFMAAGQMLDCFVANAVYGSPAAWQVATLRSLRDRLLLPTEAGQRLVRMYYTHGPGLARWVKDKPYLVRPVRGLLDGLALWLRNVDTENPVWKGLLQGSAAGLERVLSHLVEPDIRGVKKAPWWSFLAPPPRVPETASQETSGAKPLAEPGGCLCTAARAGP